MKSWLWPVGMALPAQVWKNKLIQNAERCDFPIHKPYFKLSDRYKNMLWEGVEYFEGIHAFFKILKDKNYKIQKRVMLARYRGKSVCPSCKSKRLRKECDWVKIGGKSITDLIDLPLDELWDFFEKLQLYSHEQQLSRRILAEIRNRLGFLIKIALDYLTLNRASNTPSLEENLNASIWLILLVAVWWGLPTSLMNPVA